MELVCKIGDLGDGCFLGMYNVIVFLTMDGSMDSPRIIAHMLHDINFAIIRPMEWACGTQHPDGGPRANPFWEFGSHFYLAIFPIALALGHQSCRCIFFIFPIFHSGL